ncbi:MAG TPA: hypothetical protein DCE78_11385 [Bacteroidetes bacterium]|nr:hypothetical protein [Bacteroidota bacterium]
MKSVHQLNILLVAEESAGIQALRVIKNSDHVLAGVLTKIPTSDFLEIDSGSGQIIAPNRYLSGTSLAAAAGKLGVPVLDSKLVVDPDFVSWMDSNKIDVLLNVHSLYRICPEVIQASKLGAYNLHPGPLPAYSGLNAPSWAVYNEESSHAVSLHRITEEIDSGDIAYETRFPITSNDTGLSVSVMCAEKGLKLIEQLLKDLSQELVIIPSRPQDLSLRTFYKRNQVPGGGFIQWSQPAHKIDAFVRACNYAPFPSPWGEPKTSLKNKEISIFKTEISNELCHVTPGTIGPEIGGKAAISTADYWILVERCKVGGQFVPAVSILTDGDKLSSPGK